MADEGTGGLPAGDFARDTAVWPDSDVDGRFRADLSEAWKVFYAFGGCTMAVALRAAQAAVDRPDLRPVSATAVFLSPVPCGPLTVDTSVLRRGRSAAHAVAALRAGDGSAALRAGDGSAALRAGDGSKDVGETRSNLASDAGPDLHLTAIFGSAHESHVDFVDAEWPDDAIAVEDTDPPPPPPDGSPFRDINYHEQTEWRPAMKGMAFRSDDEWIPGPARSLSWHRLLKEPRLSDGMIDPVSYCAPADILGPALFTRLGPLGPDNPPFLVLSLEISVQFIAPTSSAWILQHTRVPHAGEGYAVSHVELWDADRRLIAIANQRGHIRPVSPERFAAPDGTA